MLCSMQCSHCCSSTGYGFYPVSTLSRILVSLLDSCQHQHLFALFGPSPGHPSRYCMHTYRMISTNISYVYLLNILTGTEMAQLVCGGCHTLLMYIRGATSVQCSCCHTINLAMEGKHENVKIMTFKSINSLKMDHVYVMWQQIRQLM